MQNLGQTRSSLKSDHLLQTPDTFIRTPLTGSMGVDFIIHAGPRLGAAFTMMTAEFQPGGTLAKALSGIQRFVYVLNGELELSYPTNSSSPSSTRLGKGAFLYLPADLPSPAIQSISSTRIVLIEKIRTGASVDSANLDQAFRTQGVESEVQSESLGGDERLQVKHLMPDGEDLDFAVNTMTYDPGASLGQVEVHIMEHGLLMLEGGGIYRLGDHWYPVQAGDFIWMAPYCPQWFGAIGKTPAKYLIYKDWYRHPLGSEVSKAKP